MSEALAEDRFRLPLIATCVVLGGLLVGLWTARSARVVGEFEHCLQVPADCDGQDRTLNLHRVESIEPGVGYTLLGTHRDIPVRGPIGPLQVGDTVTVAVHVDGERGLVERWRTAHERRRSKYIAGLAGVGFLGLMVPLWFRWRRGRVVIRG